MLAAWAGWSSSSAGRGARAGCCSLCGRTWPSLVSWSIERKEIRFYIQVAGQRAWNGHVVSTGSRCPDKTSVVFWKRLDSLWKQPAARCVPAALAKVWEHGGSSLPNVTFGESESMGTVHKQKSWPLNAWNCGGDYPYPICHQFMFEGRTGARFSCSVLPCTLYFPILYPPQNSLMSVLLVFW